VFTNLRYGPHERNVLDLFTAGTPEPSPLHVFIHGGGWLHGDKDQWVERTASWRQRMLDAGVSVAYINYRYAPLPDPVLDAARAIQYLRANAATYGLDPRRVGAHGGSAGGCTTLWLATHDDLADPAAEDPVARQSTRLTVAWAGAAQTTIDPRTIAEWMGEDSVTHAMIHRAAGFPSRDAMKAGYADKAELYREYSPVNHLDADDPPILLRYIKHVDKEPYDIHHSRFGYFFKKKAETVGADDVYLHVRHGPEEYQLGPAYEPVQFVIDRLTEASDELPSR
jgi:acetyl esterase/lipase